MSQTFGVLREPLGIATLDGLDGPGVKPASTILQEASVGHLVGQRVLERVFEVGKQACLVNKFRRLKMPKFPSEIFFR